MDHTPDPAARQPLLSDAHRAELAASAIPAEYALSAGVYTEPDPATLGKLLGWKGPARGGGLVYPFFDPDGRPTGYVRVKPDRPLPDAAKPGKVRKYEAPKGKPNRLYLPPLTRTVLSDPTARLIVTEGLKQPLAADAAGFPCVGLAGVWCGLRPKAQTPGRRELLPDWSAVPLTGRAVVIAFDSDAATNPKVRAAERTMARTLTAAGAVVTVARLPAAADGTKQGIDDLLARSGPEALATVLAAAIPPGRGDGPPGSSPTVPADEHTSSRRSIELGTDEFRVNDEAAEALGTDPDVYQRGGMLVQVIAAPEPTGEAIRRPAGGPVVRELVKPLVRDRLTRVAHWREWRGGEDGGLVATHPPEWCVAAVHARGTWPQVRRLEAVVPHPVLLPDGTLLAESGYHDATGVLVTCPPDLRVVVPDAPSREDVVAAVETLLDPLADFPFQTPAHRAALVAGLLTPLAWFLFDGPAPLFLIDANVRAAGKGLLADVVSIVLTGRRFAVTAYTPDRDELRKRITALAVEGDRLALFDNLAGAVGNDVLDMALTSDRWKDRLLGSNRVYDGPLHVTWFATGNNVQLHADTARRVCHVRMESADERPELRQDVTYPDLRAHVHARRGELLAAALTILRGWLAAGRPTHGLKAWGSFEGWSAVVREAVVFAGLPDPGETRVALQSAADRDAAAMAAILDGLEHLDPPRRGLTAAEVVAQVKDTPDPPEWVGDLRSAIEELCGKLDSRLLAGRFRHFARRNFGGRMLDKAGADRTKTSRWAVFPVTCGATANARRAGDAGDAGGNPAGAGEVVTDPPPAGDAGEVRPPAPIRDRSNPHRGRTGLDLTPSSAGRRREDGRSSAGIDRDLGRPDGSVGVDDADGPDPHVEVVSREAYQRFLDLH